MANQLKYVRVGCKEETETWKKIVPGAEEGGGKRSDGIFLLTTKMRSAFWSHVELRGFMSASSGPISTKFPAPIPETP
jgi:hypothetical protein